MAFLVNECLVFTDVNEILLYVLVYRSRLKAETGARQRTY